MSTGSEESVQLLGYTPCEEPEVLCVDDEVRLEDIYPPELARDVLVLPSDSSIIIVAEYPMIDLVSSTGSELLQDVESGAEIQMEEETPPLTLLECQRNNRSRGF